MLYNKKVALVAFVSSTSGVNAFSPSSFLNTNVRATTSLDVAVDPEVATKKEYEDICGVQFDEMTLEERLKKTQFLYPKHVEVLEDFAPMVDDMVDNIVSRGFVLLLHLSFFVIYITSRFLHLLLSLSIETVLHSKIFNLKYNSCWKQVKSHGNHKTSCLILPRTHG